MKTTRTRARFTTGLIGAALLLMALPSAGQAADSTFASLATAPLAKGSGYELPNGSSQVRHLQRQLRRLGHRPGPIDGLFGPLTDGAVRRFQTKAGLRVDGLVGPSTARHLARSMGSIHRRALARERVSTRPRIHTSPVADARAVAASENTQAPISNVGESAESVRPSLLMAALFALIAAPFVVLVALMAPKWRIRTRRRDNAPLAMSAEQDHQDDYVEPPPQVAAAPPAATVTNASEPTNNGVERHLRTPVIGYVSVPDNERFEHGDEYAMQAEAIAAFCRRRGLRLVRIVRDVASPGRRSADAPGLQHACEALARGEARALVVQELARVTRSPARLALLLRWLADSDRALIAIENAFDTSTTVGRLVSGALIEVGDWDRERAAQRRAASRGGGGGGGRPAVRDMPELHARIAAMREAGLSLHAIADTLNAEGVPTLRGGSHWRPSSVQAAVGYKRPTANNADPGLILPETRHADLEEEAER
jgi:peptidoglycan hydrolase-like protein with peptidoglycan-binding domain/DNA invertase Pin-like site-specific DNA recombinase